MSDTDKYEARDALQALLDDHAELVEVNAQMAEVLRNIRVPLNVPLADYVANTEAPTTSLGITDLASLLADLDAANARVEALTLRNEELQRMVDAGLERSSEAAREAVKR